MLFKLISFVVILDTSLAIECWASKTLLTDTGHILIIAVAYVQI